MMKSFAAKLGHLFRTASRADTNIQQRDADDGDAAARDAATVTGKVRVMVSRQACCSADDQMGPLDTTYWLAPEDSFGALVEQILESCFLQFSSTHTRLTGEVNGLPVVEVFSPHSPQVRHPVFIQPAEASALAVLSGGELSFYFRHN